MGNDTVNDDYAFVTKPDQKKKWCITREHLCLSQPILPDHQKEGWKSIVDEFGVVDNFRMKALADDTLKHDNKMIAIRNMAKRFFDKDFRPIAEVGQNGVLTFYEKKAKFGREAIVTKITEKINEDLLQLWSSGEKSLVQLSGIVKTLIDYFDEEKAALIKLGSSADDEIKRRDLLLDDLNKAVYITIIESFRNSSHFLIRKVFFHCQYTFKMLFESIFSCLNVGQVYHYHFNTIKHSRIHFLRIVISS